MTIDGAMFSLKLPDGTAWDVMDRLSPSVQAFIRDEAGLDPLIAEGLLHESTRPRAIEVGAGLLITLRGVNLNEGARPEDMISLRIWAERGRVLCLRSMPIRAIEAVRTSFSSGNGPHSLGELLASICEELVQSALPVITLIEERLEEFEERVIDPDIPTERRELLALRLQTIGLHRFLLPQAVAMEALSRTTSPLLEEPQRRQIWEASNRLRRAVEDLDAVRFRASLIHEEIRSQLDEVLMTRTTALTAVAVIFLPLNLVTGLLGVNLEGIPGASLPFAFGVLCLLLAMLAVGVVKIAKRRGWL